MGVPVTVIDGEVVVGFDRPRLDRLLAGGKAGQRPRLGLKVADAAKATRVREEASVTGALVGSVAPASLGERAGIIKGDIIVEIDQKPVRSADDLEKALSGLRPGSNVAIVFLRGARTLKTDVNIS